MTGSEAFAQTLSLIQETDPAPYGLLPLGWLNFVIAQTWEVANRRREYSGLEPLEKIPVMKTLSEEIPYDDELVRRVFPLGMLVRLYTDETDTLLLDLYRREFASELNLCDRGIAVWEE